MAIITVGVAALGAEAIARIVKIITVFLARGKRRPDLEAAMIIQTDPDFIIATELSRCPENKPVDLIDEVNFDRTFAWTYVRCSKGMTARRARGSVPSFAAVNSLLQRMTGLQI